MRWRFRPLPVALVLVWGWTGSSARALAWTPPASCPDLTASLSGREWTGPLGKTLSLHAREVSLREALDRIAAQVRIRLSYSGEAVPLDRRVCLRFDAVTLGDALTSVLGDLPLRLVPLAADHVVLAPVAREVATTPPSPPVELERIVVTGSPAGASQSGLPIALDVLDGRALEQRGATTLSSAMDGQVPGLWLWEQSPVSALSQYGSIRGASSFGASYPKVYLDGIQLANPLLFTRIQSSAIDRIELIRGPQGAALYGADAISGVANIISRYDTGESSLRARFDAGIGLAGSQYTSSPAVDQSYAARFRTGSNLQSASLDVDAGATGAYFADASSRRLLATAVGRRVGEASLLTGTLRFFGMRAGTGESPVITRTLAPWRASDTSSVPAQPLAGVESLAEYTAGATLKVFPGERWQHTFTAGLDGYSLSGVPDPHTPIPLTGAGSLASAQGSASRATLRASTVVKLGNERRLADLTFSAEQSVLRQRAMPYEIMPNAAGDPDEEITRWRGNSGFTTQFTAALFGGLHFNGGVRLERDEGATSTERWATLPMAGLAWTRNYGIVGVKLRGAYGKGIRWPDAPARQTLWDGILSDEASRALKPEEQSGVEAGVDLVIGRAASFQITRFDQVASGLIQRVLLARNAGPRPDGPPTGRLGSELQNVGEITNRGWELQGTLHSGGFGLTGAYSQVDSRVRKVAQGYTGDLRAGNRMLEVPQQTLSVIGSYSAARWNAAVTAYRAYHWISYDRIALAQAFATTNRPTQDYVGWNLREFWKEYPGVTRLRASVAVTLTRSLGLTLSGDNLLNYQTGEPDNATVLPGRTVSFGVRTWF